MRLQCGCSAAAVRLRIRNQEFMRLRCGCGCRYCGCGAAAESVLNNSAAAVQMRWKQCGGGAAVAENFTAALPSDVYMYMRQQCTANYNSLFIISQHPHDNL